MWGVSVKLSHLSISKVIQLGESVPYSFPEWVEVETVGVEDRLKVFLQKAKEVRLEATNIVAGHWWVPLG